MTARSRRPPTVAAAAGPCIAFALLVRAPFVIGPLESDEAGLLMVARHLDLGTVWLYGDYWVDRPPLLIGYFWIADQLLGQPGVRALGLPVAAALVASAVVVGHQVSGRPGAWWTGWVAAALASSFAISGHMMNGMLQAAALVMASCACTIGALRLISRMPVAMTCAFAAGVFGMAAVFVKQNFVGGVVFAVVLAVSCLLTRAATPGAVARLTLAGAVGAATVVLTVVVWARSAGVRLSELWFAMYGFRAATVEVITGSSMQAPLTRLATLTAAAVLSGLLVVLWVFVRALRDTARDSADMALDSADRPLTVATVALLCVAALSVVLGGSWWTHYLVQFIPGCALATALVAPRAEAKGAAMRAAVVLAVISTVVAAAVGVVVRVAHPTDQVQVGRWLAASSAPTDTGFVTWGQAELLVEGELTSPYPYLWSLPTRTRDPDLDLLVATLQGPDAPTWVIEWNSFNSWDIDDRGRLAEVVDRRYRHVTTACGHDIHLLETVSRDLAVPAPC